VNVFNRIVMVIVILALLFLVLFVMIRPLDAVAIARANLDYFEQGLFDNQFFLWFLIVLGVAEFILLVLFYLELKQRRRKTVRVKTKAGGNAQLGVQSVAESLEYRIDELAGVRQVRPRIISRGRDVEVAVDLDTSPSVNIPVLTDQITELCRDIVTRQLGVKIKGKVKINVKHEPYPKGTMPTTGPLPEKAVVPPKTLPAAAKPVQAAPAPVAEPVAIEPVESVAAKPLVYTPQRSETPGEAVSSEADKDSEKQEGSSDSDW